MSQSSYPITGMRNYGRAICLIRRELRLGICSANTLGGQSGLLSRSLNTGLSYDAPVRGAAIFIYPLPGVQKRHITRVDHACLF